MKKKAEFGHFLVCILILIMLTWVYLNISSYPKYDVGFPWYHNGSPTLIHILCFIVIYLLIGRFLVFFAKMLTILFDKLGEGLDISLNGVPIEFNKWTPSITLYGIVLVPLTVIVIGFLIIVNLLIFIYRFLV